MEPSALLTDLYQLAMLQGYVDHGMEGEAVFEFFIRRLPPRRNFLVAAGLEPALQFLESFRFDDADLDWVARSGRFNDRLLARLRGLRFTGSVEALPEGTVCFPGEPLLRVAAPLPEAQVIESRLINLLHFSTLVASKAARMVLVAPGKLLVDFGLRRAHGAEAALLAARASYLAGFSGTANVLAARDFGIPAHGTMAHSFIQAHASEEDAFERFAASQPKNAVLLIDTYDTVAAARKVVALAPRLAARGIAVQGVRLDSGDLLDLSRQVRAILDAGGLRGATIFASGGLDEEEIARLLAAGAPIDGFGPGTLLDTSADAPYLDCAYKLVEYEGRPRRKRSTGKETRPGRKQVFRRLEASGRLAGDLLALEGETAAGEPLLRPAMRAGRRVAAAEPLAESRRRAAAGLDSLPVALRDLGAGAPYTVALSPALERLALEADRAATAYRS
jgi:nicotinate phosphoribosyltransferase